MNYLNDIINLLQNILEHVGEGEDNKEELIELYLKVGDLNDLKTENKDNIVNALNESFSKAIKEEELFYEKEVEVESDNFIDLGLPSGTLWATCNLGANAPHENGLYFQWGATEGHEAGDGYNFARNNYPHSGISADLTEEQDAAAVMLGNGCRMPSIDEFDELAANCYMEYVADYNGTGIAGTIIYSCRDNQTGKGFYKADNKWYIKIGQSYTAYNPSGFEPYTLDTPHIFLPGAGRAYKYDITFLSYCWYLTRTFLTRTAAHLFETTSYGAKLSAYNDRELGFPIRPVSSSKPIILEKQKFIKPELISKEDINNEDIKTEGSGVVKTTYDELKALRDNGELFAGTWYRITNYQCTTTQKNTRSAAHQFDILVLALDEKTLSEEARAIQHEGDTYFDGRKLEAWEIRYCLDNDTTRFVWADEDNGKGVIYLMIDEWNNDVPYDFQNIIFVKEGVEKLTFGSNCKNNKIFNNTSGLNFITLGNNCYYNIFGVNCTNITFGNNAHSNIFGSGCMNCTFGNGCHTNTIGASCQKIIADEYFQFCEFGRGVYNIELGYSNRFIVIKEGSGAIKFGTVSSTTRFINKVFIESGVYYLYINCTENTSEYKCAQHIHVNSGVCGASMSNRKTLTIPTAGNNFLTTFGSANDVKIDV